VTNRTVRKQTKTKEGATKRGGKRCEDKEEEEILSKKDRCRSTEKYSEGDLSGDKTGEETNIQLEEKTKRRQRGEEEEKKIKKKKYCP
jgi:hypothetical protein